MPIFDAWRRRVQLLKREAYTLYLACRDLRVPWLGRLCAGVVVAYAFSPIDLIPDCIPVIGLLDDMVLVPVGILLVRSMIPPLVMQECRAQAEEIIARGKPINRTAAAVFVAIWVLLVAALVYYLVRKIWH